VGLTPASGGREKSAELLGLPETPRLSSVGVIEGEEKRGLPRNSTVAFAEKGWCVGKIEVVGVVGVAVALPSSGQVRCPTDTGLRDGLPSQGPGAGATG